MTAHSETTPCPKFTRKKARCARTEYLKKEDRLLLRRYIKRLTRLIKKHNDVSRLNRELYLDSLLQLSAPENKDMADEIGYNALLLAVEDLLSTKISDHDKETQLLGVRDQKLEETIFNASLDRWELRYCGGSRVLVSADTKSMWIYKDDCIRADQTARLNDAMTLFC